jgi:primosomal protein N' (replication factor Y)
VCEALSGGPSAAAPPGGESAAVLGPATLFRLRGRERSVLMVKARERRPAVHAVGEAVQRVAGARGHAGVNFSVDVDPQ